MTLEDFLRQLAEQAVNGMAGSGATFDRILAPVREGFAESGLSEDEVVAEFKAARTEVWEAARKPKS